MGKLSHNIAMDIADSCDLPDGAYWAMIEGLSGAKPSDFVGDGKLKWPTKQERKKHKKAKQMYLPERQPKREKELARLGYKAVRFSDHHIRINEIVDWWPTADKWRVLGGNGKAENLFQNTLNYINSKIEGL